MTEALLYTAPPLRRGDRFVFNFAYTILGDENLVALTDPTVTVIGELDQQSYDDFYKFCSDNNLDNSTNFFGNVRWQRANGAYEVEFDVDTSRIYIAKQFLTAKQPDRVSQFTEKALP